MSTKESIRAVHKDYESHESVFYPKNIETSGLAEIYFDSLSRNKSHIHQVEPFANLTETCGSVRIRAVRVAQLLKKEGVKERNVIMIMSRTHADQTVAVLACLAVGAVVAPIDSEESLAETGWYMTQLKPKLVFCDARCIGAVRHGAGVSNLKCRIVTFGTEKEGALFFSKIFLDPDQPRVNFVPQKITEPRRTCAFIVPTQGIMGKPKLAMLSHYAIRYQSNCYYNCFLKETSAIITCYPLCWSMQVLLTCACFEHIFTKVLIGSLNVRNVCRAIHDLKVDTMILSPMFANITCHMPSVYDFDLGCLKRIHVGGGMISSVLIDSLRGTFMQVDISVWYSITEVGIVSVFKIKDIYETLQKTQIGCKLCPGIRVRLVDIHHKKALPVGACGEIFVIGPGLWQGYLKQSTSQVLKFADGMFKTDDFGYYDSKDLLYVKGRVNEVIIRKDVYYSPVDIEYVIDYCPGVFKAMVTSLHNDKIYALIVPTEDSRNLTEEKVMRYMKSRCKPELLPTEIKFVSSLPLSPIGKIKRYEVIEKLQLKTVIIRSYSVDSMGEKTKRK